MIDVPGATLHYRTQGHGPLLLLLQGGDGDAGGADAIAGRLADDHTVVTYDRRGLSRSQVDDLTAAPGIATHGDDVHRLLSDLTDEPVLVVGFSIGALIGLDLVARHPQQVRLLVAHEPPAFDLLPEADRAEVLARLERIEHLFRERGPVEAMRAFVALSGFDITDREAEVELPRPNPERAANMAYFLTHDAPAVRAYHLDLPALREAASRIVPAVGVTSRAATGADRCARALGVELDVAVEEFPGGHSGFVLRPKAFTEKLREVFHARVH